MTNSSLVKSATVVGFGTLVSRLLGLVREILMARFFGTSLAASAFFVAFMIPNLLRRFFGEGALSAAFIPSYVKTRDQEGQEAAWQLTRNVGTLLFLTLSVLAGLLMGLTTLWMQVDGLHERVAAVLPLLRIMLPYMIGICLAALAMGVQNSHRRYAVPAYTPCILNLLWIAALYLVCPWFGDQPEEQIQGVAWSVLLSGLLQFAVQIPVLLRLGFRPRGAVNLRHPKVRRVLWLMGPAALGAAVTQINVLLDKTLALWVADYGPSALQYAERLIYLPLGLFATAMATVLLPELSSLAHRREAAAIAKTVRHGLQFVLFFMVPAAVGLGVLAEPIIRMMFARGAFEADSVLYTQRALLCYAPGLVVFSAAKVFVPVFYAHEDTRTPVRVGILAVAVNLTLNLLFVWCLPIGWKHAGLALGTVIAELVQVSLLAILLTRRYANPDWARIGLASLRYLAASLPMVLLALGVMNLLPALSPVLSVTAGIGLGMVVYFLLCRWLGCAEPAALLRILHR